MQFDGVTLHSFNRSKSQFLLNPSKDLIETHIHFIAVSSLNSAYRNVKLKTIFNEGIAIVDSKPLALALNLFGNRCENLRGTDFMRQAILQDSGEKRHFLIGSTSDSLEKLRRQAKLINPKFNIVGMISPKFKQDFFEDYRVWGLYIAESHADVIWIGLGSPKQDYVANDLTNMFGVKTIAVGAAFDLISTTIREAPKILQKLSLEWVFRLIIEPKRLWRRYLLGNTFFIMNFTKLYVLHKFKSLSNSFKRNRSII